MPSLHKQKIFTAKIDRSVCLCLGLLLKALFLCPRCTRLTCKKKLDLCDFFFFVPRLNFACRWKSFLSPPKVTECFDVVWQRRAQIAPTCPKKALLTFSSSNSDRLSREAICMSTSFLSKCLTMTKGVWGTLQRFNLGQEMGRHTMKNCDLNKKQNLSG